jgi:hydroxyacylglutathione hydrolase
MNIKSYSFYPIDAKMYLLVENHRAVILDPCVSEEAKEYLQSENVEEIIVLLTHEHYDHISGINWLRESFKRTKVICSEACGAALGKPHKNLSEYYEIFNGKKEWNFESHKIVMQETPGHSKGSICILVDEKILFSGDTLVTGHETILRLPGGSKKDFAGITLPYLESLDREIMVYPGHGEPQKLKRFFD